MTPVNKPASPGDSLLGVALAQAFMGVVYGPCVHMLWEAGEIASAVYEDRRGNDSGNFFLGVKNSLAGAFARASEQTVAEFERSFFRPFQPAYAPAFSKI